MNIAEFTNVHRAYVRGTDVLAGVSFAVEPGQIVALLGKNGAGKTTLIRIAMGMIEAQQGAVKIFGLDPREKPVEVKRRVGYVSEDQILPPFLRVREVVDLHRGLFPTWDDELARHLGERFTIDPEAKIKTLSKGMLAQLHLALVLAIDAKLLVLDEPTLGLDILYRKRFYRQLLDDYMTEQRTLLITTHQVEEIEFMLTNIMIMHHGKIVLDAPVEDLGRRYTQLLVDESSKAEAERLRPIHHETRFGQTVMVFENVDRERLEELGQTATPSLSDLFVALMQRQSRGASSEAA